MADKKAEGKSKVVLERTYVVPLRREWLKVPKYRRAKKAVTALRQFVAKHMKSDIVKISSQLNVSVWSRGIRNPPHKIKIKASKDDKDVVTVLPDVVGKERIATPLKKGRAKREAAESKKKAEPKKAAAKPEDSKKEEASDKKVDDAKPAEKKETPKAEDKPAKKSESADKKE